MESVSLGQDIHYLREWQLIIQDGFFYTIVEVEREEVQVKKISIIERKDGTKVLLENYDPLKPVRIEYTNMYPKMVPIQEFNNNGKTRPYFLHDIPVRIGQAGTSDIYFKVKLGVPYVDGIIKLEDLYKYVITTALLRKG